MDKEDDEDDAFADLDDEDGTTDEDIALLTDTAEAWLNLGETVAKRAGKPLSDEPTLRDLIARARAEFGTTLTGEELHE